MAITAVTTLAATVLGLAYVFCSGSEPSERNYDLLHTEDPESTGVEIATSTALTIYKYSNAPLHAEEPESTPLGLMASTAVALVNVAGGVLFARPDLMNLGLAAQDQIDRVEEDEIDQVEQDVALKAPDFHIQAQVKEESPCWPEIQFTPVMDRWILDSKNSNYVNEVKENAAHCPDIEMRGIQIYRTQQENAKTLIFSKSTRLQDQLNSNTVKEVMFWNGKIKSRPIMCVYATGFLQSKIPGSILVWTPKPATHLQPSFFPGLASAHHQFGFMDPENGLYFILDATPRGETMPEKYNSILIVASSQEELMDTYQCVFGFDCFFEETNEEIWQKDHGFPRSEIFEGLQLGRDFS